MPSLASSSFTQRHIGLSEADIHTMCASIGVRDLEELIEKSLPEHILQKDFQVSDALTEVQWRQLMQTRAQKNKVYQSFIGQGFYPSIMPAVVQRNVWENPAWYTAYTPYQAEISQGRLEALFHFQTMVSELTGLNVANASLLDDASACAEAMLMAKRIQHKKGIDGTLFLADSGLHAHIKRVLLTRATPLGINIKWVQAHHITTTIEGLSENIIGGIFAYQNSEGVVQSIKTFATSLHSRNALFIVHTDPLLLALYPAPGDLGADIAVGSVQRFGLPMGYGGPHAAFISCKDDFIRELPGRIVGASIDAQNKRAFRLSLQTREQHIKRERATSNICTAQSLLAILSTFYAQFHAAEGLKNIAQNIYTFTYSLRTHLNDNGYTTNEGTIFDTLTIYGKNAPQSLEDIHKKALAAGINFYYGVTGQVSLSIDETTTEEQLQTLSQLFTGKSLPLPAQPLTPPETRTEPCLRSHPFQKPTSETELLRYIRHLEQKDLSLAHAMIPLGSCTMKLNSTSSLMPLSDPSWIHLHPLAPKEQTEGFQEIIEEVQQYLQSITGFAGITFQPNSGAQGEFTGLMIMRAYHEYQSNTQRKTVLIPTSAHGTNPASAALAGMDIALIATREDGTIDIEDLQQQLALHKDTLAGCMITYPSTYGFFEKDITTICQLIHDNGGLVYMDGANMNAQTGYCSPASIGADMCHLNLHKTFSIPHGGGGPGAGPVGVTQNLLPFLPENPLNGAKSTPHNMGSVSNAPYGSALLLLITHAYIRMLGTKGLQKATQCAILNANYIKERLKNILPIRFNGEKGYVAHELIIDLRKYKKSCGITEIDVAKRLIDYGFHPPTVAFPIPGTLMIEPTESESKAELDRFCDALISIAQEIKDIEDGHYPKDNNLLKNAPHPIQIISADKWTYPYTRSQAAFPLPHLIEKKCWPSIARINDAYGDRNICCTYTYLAPEHKM